MSLWNDEVMTMRTAIVGKVRRDSRDRLRVVPVSWMETAFNYWQPNNHVLYSLAARLSHAAWPRNSSSTAPYFQEIALRFPAYLAGLGVWRFCLRCC